MTDVEGFQKGVSSVSGLSQPYIERKRTASEDGRTYWGQERFNIFQTLEGLKPGKYELGASVIATQQGKSGEAARNYVKRRVFVCRRGKYAGGFTGWGRPDVLR